MAEELLASLVGLFGTALLAIATLAGAFLWRRLQDLQERMWALEARLDRLIPYEEAIAKAGGKFTQSIGRRRRRG